MIYSIEWDLEKESPKDLNIPGFLYIDSLPLRDEDSNIYSHNLIFHISPNDFSYFHRNQYPDCFKGVISKSFPEYKIRSFNVSTIIDIENYIKKS